MANNANEEQDPQEFVCPLCEKKTTVNRQSTRREFIYGSADHLQHDSSICRLQCKHCQKDTAVLHKDFWVPISEFLHKPGAKDGLKQVSTESERILLYVLSQVCHNQHDLDLDSVKDTEGESPFECHPPGELAWLFWVDGQAVGLYTVKDKGVSLFDDPYDHDVYQLPMIDTIYVCHNMRGRGLATQMVQHYLAQYPNQNAGFSAPVSVGLLRVLHKILLSDGYLRDLLWECSYDGSEGYRRNIWFHTRCLFKNKQRNIVSKPEKPGSASNQTTCEPINNSQS